MNYQDQIIERRIKEKQERIEKAIDRKEKSIAFWCSTERAVEIVIGLAKKGEKRVKLEKNISLWRDWFFKQWQEWYLENIVALENQKRDKEETKLLMDEAFAEQWRESEERYWEAIERAEPII
jgi:DNA gyrase/topoisomerase IV subunit A